MTKLVKVEKIIIHCTYSDFVEDDNIEKIRELHMTPPDKKVWFRGRWYKGKGWDDIAYHFFIPKDGSLQAGRPLTVQGAHTLGHNHNSLSICLGGDIKFALAQFRTLFNISDTLKSTYNLTDAEIFGHYHFSDYKSCPNFLVNL